AAVTAVSVDPAATRAAHGVEAIDHRDLPGVVLAARRAAAVVLGGGGLVQDQTSPWNLPYHLSRVWAARAWRTPVAAVGLGAGPVDTRLGRAFARATLAPLATVTTRDAASAEVLHDRGAAAPTVAADLALSLPVPEVAATDRLVVALRPWRGRRRALPVGVSRPGAEAAPPWFVDGVASALDAAAGATGLAVRFVALQADRDGPLHEQVAGRMRTPATTCRPGLDTVVDEIAAGRLVVAMRYHALVAAVLGARPRVALTDSPTVASLAADAGAGTAALGWSRDGLAGLAGAVERAAAAGEGTAAALAEARERLRRREQANGDALARVLPVLA
ncbi:MAG: polysaccharide pyruvyl transferase family protein, partial [Acidimicrobiia bacterium]